MKMPRFKLCFVVALIGFCIAPYFSNLLPGGGSKEQRWLDREMKFIEQRLETLKDPEMRVAFEYALKYNKIGRFRVRVMQLPEGIWAYNMPTCPGITIDEEVLDLPLSFGAFVIIHEGMHEFFPYLCHFHIDDEQILRSL